MSTTFNGTEQKILNVVTTLTQPVSRATIITAAGIADGSNVTKALVRLEAAMLISSSRVGRSTRYMPVPADIAEEANFAAGEAEDAAAWTAPAEEQVEDEATADEQEDTSPARIAELTPDELARLIVYGPETLAPEVQAVTKAMPVEERAAVRTALLAIMPEGERRLRVLFEAGLQPTREETESAKAVNAAKRAARGEAKRSPKARPLFNTTERYIVNTLAYFRTAMTRKEVDQACKLRGGSIAGHAVKRAYEALVERGVLARAGDGDAERFQITDDGYTQYVATLGGAPVELLLVPQWVPPAKRASVAA